MKIKLLFAFIFMFIGFVLFAPTTSAEASSSATVTVTVRIAPPEKTIIQSEKDQVQEQLPKIIVKVSGFIHETTAKSSNSNYYLVNRQ